MSQRPTSEPVTRTIRALIREGERRARSHAIQVGALEDRALAARLDALERWATGLSFDPTADTESTIAANAAASLRRQLDAADQPADPATTKECKR